MPVKMARLTCKVDGVNHSSTEFSRCKLKKMITLLYQPYGVSEGQNALQYVMVNSSFNMVQ